MKKIFFYTARLLSVLFTGFLFLFILEGFDVGFGWQDGFSHAILALIFLVATIIAWKKPNIGGWGFIILCMFFSVFFKISQWSQAIIVAIPFIIGVLFLI